MSGKPAVCGRSAPTGSQPQAATPPGRTSEPWARSGPGFFHALLEAPDAFESEPRALLPSHQLAVLHSASPASREVT